MPEIGQIYVSVGGDTSELDRALSNAVRTAEQSARALADAGTTFGQAWDQGTDQVRRSLEDLAREARAQVQGFTDAAFAAEGFALGLEDLNRIGVRTELQLLQEVQALEALKRQFADDTAVAGQLEIRLERLTRELARFDRAADGAADGAEGLGRAKGQLGTASSRTNLVMFEFARGLEDLQYGFRGVQNNIQQAAIAAGAGGPWVVALTVAGLAVATFSDEIQDAFGGEARRELETFREALDSIAGGLIEIEKRAQIKISLSADPTILANNLAAADAALDEVDRKLAGLTTPVATDLKQAADESNRLASGAIAAFENARTLTDEQKAQTSEVRRQRAALEEVKEQIEERKAALEAEQALLQAAGRLNLNLVDTEKEKTRSGLQYKNSVEAATAAAVEQLETTRSLAGLIRDLAADVEGFEGVKEILPPNAAQILEQQIGTLRRLRGEIQDVDDLIREMTQEADQGFRDLAERLGDDLSKGIDTTNKAMVAFGKFTSDALSDMVAQIVLARGEFESLADVARLTFRAIVAQGIRIAVSAGIRALTGGPAGAVVGGATGAAGSAAPAIVPALSTRPGAVPVVEVAVPEIPPLEVAVPAPLKVEAPKLAPLAVAAPASIPVDVPEIPSLELDAAEAVANFDRVFTSFAEQMGTFLEWFQGDGLRAQGQAAADRVRTAFEEQDRVARVRRDRLTNLFDPRDIFRPDDLHLFIPEQPRFPDALPDLHALNTSVPTLPEQARRSTDPVPIILYPRVSVETGQLVVELDRELTENGRTFPGREVR